VEQTHDLNLSAHHPEIHHVGALPHPAQSTTKIIACAAQPYVGGQVRKAADLVDLKTVEELIQLDELDERRQ
jgi:hypothetical protein